jgi:hypothetical protein
LYNICIYHVLYVLYNNKVKLTLVPEYKPKSGLVKEHPLIVLACSDCSTLILLAAIIGNGHLTQGSCCWLLNTFVALKHHLFWSLWRLSYVD